MFHFFCFCFGNEFFFFFWFRLVRISLKWATGTAFSLKDWNFAKWMIRW
jgi:hypothetical protein